MFLQIDNILLNLARVQDVQLQGKILVVNYGGENNLYVFDFKTEEAAKNAFNEASYTVTHKQPHFYRLETKHV